MCTTGGPFRRAIQAMSLAIGVGLLGKGGKGIWHMNQPSIKAISQQSGSIKVAVV